MGGRNRELCVCAQSSDGHICTVVASAGNKHCKLTPCKINTGYIAMGYSIYYGDISNCLFASLRTIRRLAARAPNSDDSADSLVNSQQHLPLKGRS